MQKELTAMEQLDLLPEPERSLAIENANKQGLDSRNFTASNISSALSMAFIWRETPQGHTYWLETSYLQLLAF